MNFKKAKQNRIFQDVVEQIEMAILDARIGAGERLPAERELCEMFQTSRGTLREALRILEQKSLIEIRLGVNGGAYVKDANAELMAENLAMLIRSQTISLAHLAEFREGVEGSVARLAAQRASSVDIIKLYGLLAKADDFRKSGTSGWSDFVRIDERIHTEIARIAGNPLYVFILSSVHDNIQRYYDTFLRVGTEEMEENYRDLGQIIEAIKNGEEEAASSRASEHVRKFSGYMEQKKRKIIPIQ